MPQTAKPSSWISIMWFRGAQGDEPEQQISQIQITHTQGSFEHRQTHSKHRQLLTEVFKQIFAVISCHVMNSAITLIPPLNILFAVTAQHLQTLLYAQNNKNKQKKCIFSTYRKLFYPD